MTYRICRLIPLLLLGLFTARDVEAQRLSDPPSEEQCQEWSTQLTAGDSAALHALTYGYLPGCPAIAPFALAGAIRGARQSQDTVLLGRLAANAGDVREIGVFAAALEVAGDRTASSASRVMGLLVVVAHLGSSQDPLGLPRSQLFTQTLPASGICGFEINGGPGPTVDYTLPADVDQLAAAAMDKIRYSTAEPALLRNFARCARTAVPGEIPPQIDGSKVRLTYLCGDTFTIRNQSGATLPATMKIIAENGAVDSHFQQIVATNFAIRYVAPMTGTVEMWYDGRRIATVANEGTECLPW